MAPVWCLISNPISQLSQTFRAFADVNFANALGVCTPALKISDIWTRTLDLLHTAAHR